LINRLRRWCVDRWWRRRVNRLRRWRSINRLRGYIATKEIRKPSSSLHLHLRNKLISINISRHLLLKHRRRCVNRLRRRCINWRRWSVYRLWLVNRLWWRRVDRRSRRIATKEAREASRHSFHFHLRDEPIPLGNTNIFVVLIYLVFFKKRSTHHSLHRVLDCEMRHP
jgi:hypothetical protein